MPWLLIDLGRIGALWEAPFPKLGLDPARVYFLLSVLDCVCNVTSRFESLPQLPFSDGLWPGIVSWISPFLPEAAVAPSVSPLLGQAAHRVRVPWQRLQASLSLHPAAILLSTAPALQPVPVFLPPSLSLSIPLSCEYALLGLKILPKIMIHIKRHSVRSMKTSSEIPKSYEGPLKMTYKCC